MTGTPQQPASPQPQPPPQATQQPAAPQPGKPDLTMAWLSHLLMLFTWFIGPMVIWLVKKDQDKFAAFHGKQAMFWSIALTIAVVVLWILTILFAFLGPLAFLPMCLLWLLCLGNLAYVIVAIIFTAQGKPFKYILVADMFCKNEFAAAYPNAGAGQPTA